MNPVNNSIDADAVYARFRHELPSGLPDSSVVVANNAAFHRRDDIQRAITSRGHELQFLPPCSPDLNPVEHKRARAEALRKKQRCSVEEQ